MNTTPFEVATIAPKLLSPEFAAFAAVMSKLSTLKLDEMPEIVSATAAPFTFAFAVADQVHVPQSKPPYMPRLS
ncbi:MAG: hypothetical protein IPI67_14030 [Myxococcales bacterium]|nr:hypothetical protein [Myxococcales bacterium]